MQKTEDRLIMGDSRKMDGVVELRFTEHLTYARYHARFFTQVISLISQTALGGR